MKIFIAGGGIGGLTAALSLHAAGFEDVHVLEAARELLPLGVGLNILPNAVRELTELGLYEELVNNAITTSELALYSRHGQLIWKEPRGLAAGYHWPQLSIHRGYLQSVLARAVRERLGPAAITTHTRVTDCSQDRKGKVAVTLDRVGSDTTVVRDVDLLIGADGIRSAVRASLYPNEGPPPDNGMIMMRGTTWTESFLDGQSMIVTGDDSKRIVLYPIAQDRPRGRSLINWVAARPADDDLHHRGDWSREGSVDDVLEHFGDWHFDWLDIPAILRSATAVYQYPMVDRDSLSRWTFGHVTLLGDAAHAMYPMGSNGATQSIVDARALAHALATSGDIPEALLAYEAERRPAMTLLQASNRRQGPEAVITTVHQRAPDGFNDLHDVISATELAEVSARYAMTGGFGVTAVNGRASRSTFPSKPTAREK
ncbi:flavin-dependent oxidoreductase [Streptomyces sp. NPDC088354]|uniref:flavin-dependent oxidoreductase n=1 Tax=Streptomyces sp. NPDC088354 TaxID=3365856 RepID=UPI0037FC66F9